MCRWATLPARCRQLWRGSWLALWQDVGVGGDEEGDCGVVGRHPEARARRMHVKIGKCVGEFSWRRVRGWRSPRRRGVKCVARRVYAEVEHGSPDSERPRTPSRCGERVQRGLWLARK